MKMTDLRAKARAIFGSAVAEPMPKQPNGAKALQERANARPIPTYKNGGKVGMKKDGLAVMIAVGKPVKEKSTGEVYSSKKAMAKHEAKESPTMEKAEHMKKPVKRAAGGAGKTRKGMC